MVEPGFISCVFAIKLSKYSGLILPATLSSKGACFAWINPLVVAVGAWQLVQFNSPSNSKPNWAWSISLP